MMGSSLEQLMSSFPLLATSGAQALLPVAIAVVIGAVAIRFVRAGLKRVTEAATKSPRAGETVSGFARRRVQEMAGVIGAIAAVVIWSIVGITSLVLVGLDITPLLAGAGIVGMAVSFGAWNLARDLRGSLAIPDDRVRAGDLSVMNGTVGLMETISLRDFSGAVHIFPNGAAHTPSPMAKEWSVLALDMGVVCKEDLDHVAEVMRRVGEELRLEPLPGPKLFEPVEIVAIENSAESSGMIRVRIKTRPFDRWSVGREYLRRLMRTLDAEGVIAPFLHRSIYLGERNVPVEVPGCSRLGHGCPEERVLTRKYILRKWLSCSF